MPDVPSQPGTLFVVSELRDGKWHDIEATRDETKAHDLLKKLGDKGQASRTQAAATETTVSSTEPAGSDSVLDPAD